MTVVWLTPVNRVIARRDTLIGGGDNGAIFDLTGENVADQLAELYGIAGAFKALGCHRGSMPSVSAVRERATFQTVPLPGRLHIAERVHPYIWSFLARTSNFPGAIARFDSPAPRKKSKSLGATALVS